MINRAHGRNSARRYLVLTVAVLTLAATGAQAAEPAKSAALPIESMRATAYTKAFAKRFALPDPSTGTEPEGGLQAIEFRVESAPPHSFGYNCKLNLYFDASLPIAYPEEGVAGARRLYIQPTHFFLWPDPENKRWLSLSEKDRLYFSEKAGRYNRRAFLATPDYRWTPGGDASKRVGWASGMFYEEYHRNIFPGLAYVKIDMACPAYSSMDSLKVVQIWLEREGGRDYRKQLREEPEDFLKFTIPQSFYRKMLGWLKETAHYNRTIVESSTKQQKAN